MKRILLIIIITMVMAATLISCGKEKVYKLPWDPFCYETQNSQIVSLDSSDRNYIIDILNSGEWSDKIDDPENDYVFYPQEQTIMYHSESGTFTDITNNRSLVLSEKDRIKINETLKGEI